MDTIVSLIPIHPGKVLKEELLARHITQKKSLSIGTPDNSQQKFLEDLDKNLSEESNPVYIIGKIVQ